MPRRTKREEMKDWLKMHHAYIVEVKFKDPSLNRDFVCISTGSFEAIEVGEKKFPSAISVKMIGLKEILL